MGARRFQGHGGFLFVGGTAAASLLPCAPVVTVWVASVCINVLCPGSALSGKNGGQAFDILGGSLDRKSFVGCDLSSAFQKDDPTYYGAGRMSAMGKIWKKLVNNVKMYIFFFVLNYKELEVDSLDFLFGIAAKLLSYAAEILSLLFIFELVPEINGWDKYQVFFVYGLNLVGFSLWSSFFINTITLPYYIRRGEFDRFLVRPVSPLTQIMLDGFDDDSFGEFATGIVILIYSWVKLKISPWYLPVALIAAVSGCFVYAGISILLSSFSFFTVGNADVANFTMQIKDIAKYPMTIYPKVLQFVFTFIFPVAFVAFLPMRMIMGDIGVFLIMLVPLVSGAFYWFSKKIWMLSLRHYGSSGS